MNKKIFIVSEKELDAVVDYLFDLMKNIHIFAFVGALGAGKTTLIRELLKRWGIEQKITSPTFGYLNIYENNVGHRFYHFDLYRLNTVEQFEAAGFEEYLHIPNSWVFIEWPALIMNKLHNKSCSVIIEYADDADKRKITVSKII